METINDKIMILIPLVFNIIVSGYEYNQYSQAKHEIKIIDLDTAKELQYGEAVVTRNMYDIMSYIIILISRHQNEYIRHVAQILLFIMSLYNFPNGLYSLFHMFGRKDNKHIHNIQSIENFWNEVKDRRTRPLCEIIETDTP